MYCHSTRNFEGHFNYIACINKRRAVSQMKLLLSCSYWVKVLYQRQRFFSNKPVILDQLCHIES